MRYRRSEATRIRSNIFSSGRSPLPLIRYELISYFPRGKSKAFSSCLAASVGVNAVRQRWRSPSNYLGVSGGFAPLAPSREHCPLHPHQTLAARQRGKSRFAPCGVAYGGVTLQGVKGFALRPPYPPAFGGPVPAGPLSAVMQSYCP